jgi:hypothetical protein
MPTFFDLTVRFTLLAAAASTAFAGNWEAGTFFLAALILMKIGSE